MKPTPLFLKLRGSADSPQLHLSADNAITFQDKKYEFSSIFHDSIPSDALQSLTNTSATLILAGPTGSGKTTSLLEIVRFFAAQGANVSVTACEINKNSSFVDLLDDNASKRYLSSLPFDNQLKKLALDSRVVAKISKEKSGISSSSNVVSSRSCMFVNIYHDSKTLTLVDMVNLESFNLGAANSSANSSTKTSAGRGLSRSQGGRSQNSIGNLISRRVSSSNISMIMHLEQAGSPDLIQSSLASIIQTVNTLSMIPKKATKPSVSSVASSKVPNYAKPTASSATPSRPLSSYKVSKPTKRRVGASIDKSSEATPRQKALLRQRTHSTSPSTNSVELMTLRETVANLQGELGEAKKSYLKSIETLRVQMLSIKNESLVNLKNDLSTTRIGFEKVTAELERQGETARFFEHKATQLNTEKDLVDSKLADSLRMLNEQNEEFAKVREVLADERRSLAATFETELNSMREASNNLEEKIASLSQSNSNYELEVSRLSNERDSLRKENENLLLQVNQSENEKKVLEERVQETQRLVHSGGESSKALQTEISEKLNQLQELKEESRSDRALLAEKTSELVEQMEMNKHNLQKIESLERHIDAQNQEHSQKEEIMRQKMDSEAKENRDEIERVESLVNDMNSKYEDLKKMRQVQADEMVALNASLEQKENALANAQKYEHKCIEFESKIQELSQKAKQQEIEHEKQVMRLNEELIKAKAPTESPKKLIDFPELDFNHDNNTFSSIDIFEDQTDYMMFRRPAVGRSPMPSPTRVLTDSNTKANTEPKPMEKPAVSGLHLVSNVENLEVHDS